MSDLIFENMSNVEKFKEIFNRIEQWMRGEVDIDKGSRQTISHSKLIDKLALQNPYVKEYSSRLHAFRSLRNALVHWPKASDGKSIAEPHQEVIEEYLYIYNALNTPPSILQIGISIQNIYSVTWNDCISPALEKMVQCNYRQVPIVSRRENDVFLEGIFDFFHYGFISAQKCNDVGQFLLQSTDTFGLYKDILDLENNGIENASIFVRPDTTVLQAEKIFVSHFKRDKLLTSMLITQDGNPKSAFLGMLTAHDIPSLSGKID